MAPILCCGSDFVLHDTTRHPRCISYLPNLPNFVF